MIIGYK